MARELRSFPVTVPAGTPITAPQVTNLTMPPRIVTGFRVRVPPGPRGNLGWSLSVAGTRIIPWGADQWFVVDDEIIDEQLDGQIDSGAWQLAAYNTGTFAHTLYVTFRLDLVGARAAGASPEPLTIIA